MYSGSQIIQGSMITKSGGLGNKGVQKREMLGSVYIPLF